MLEAHIKKVSAWIDGVHTENAARRIAESRAASARKDLGGAWQSPATPAEMIRVAHHEAAHAAVAHVFGLHPTSACVRGDGSGAVSYPAEPTVPDEFLLRAITDLAGIAFEVQHFADDLREQTLAHSHDVLAARVHLDSLRARAPGWGVTTETAVQMSLCVTAANLPRINRVAAVLRALGELTGAEIAALCGRSQ